MWEVEVREQHYVPATSLPVVVQSVARATSFDENLENQRRSRT